MNWASTCTNQIFGSAGNKGGSFKATTDISPAVGRGITTVEGGGSGRAETTDPLVRRSEARPYSLLIILRSPMLWYLRQLLL